MTIRIKCECGKTYQVGDEHVGRKAKCKQCGATLAISKAAPSASVASAKDSQEDRYAIVNWTIITGPEAVDLAKERGVLDGLGAQHFPGGRKSLATEDELSRSEDFEVVTMKRKRQSPSMRLRNIWGTINCPNCVNLTRFDISSMSQQVECRACGDTYSLYRKYFTMDGVPAIVLMVIGASQPPGGSASSLRIDVQGCKEVQVEPTKSAAPHPEKKVASQPAAKRLKKKQAAQSAVDREEKLVTSDEFPWIVTHGLGCRKCSQSRESAFLTVGGIKVEKVRIKIPRRGTHRFHHRCKHCGDRVTIAAKSHETEERQTLILFFCFLLVAVCILIAGIFGLATGGWGSQPDETTSGTLVFPTILTVVGGIGTLLFGFLSAEPLVSSEKTEYYDQGHTFLPNDHKHEKHLLLAMGQWENGEWEILVN